MLGSYILRVVYDRKQDLVDTFETSNWKFLVFFKIIEKNKKMLKKTGISIFVL